jgi:hypothetical protein
MAEIEVDTILRIFETPPQNATPAELRTVSTVDMWIHVRLIIEDGDL